jgi:CheY-like chemotaxis protein
LRDHIGSRATVVALTGYGQETDRRKSRESGFEHHLVKPVALDDLKRLLNVERTKA